MYAVSVLLWSTVLAGLIFLFHKFVNYYINYKKLIDAIPGPPGYPFIGNVIDLSLPQDEIWQLLRVWNGRYNPIYKIWMTSVYSSVFLMDPDDIEVVLSGTKHTKKSGLYELLTPWLGTGLLTSTGAKWQTRRKILTPTFHFNILQQFVRIFKDQSELLIKTIQENCHKDYIDVVPVITDFTLRSICETAMGTSLDPNDKKSQSYVKSIYRLGELIISRVLSPWAYCDLFYFFNPERWELVGHIKSLHKFSTKVIQERKENFKDDILTEDKDIGTKKRLAMLDLLISAQKNDANIDDEGIREEVDTFMFEGHDTTSMGISFALLSIANHPEIQQRVVDEQKEIFGDSDRFATFQDLQNMNYLEMVLKESLRLYPSVPMIGRETEEEIRTPSGYVIPAQTHVHVFIFDLHRNPEIYPKPEKFDPDRFLPENTQKRHPFAYLPFSAGPRNCIGQRFAMLELKSAVSTILRKFKLEPVDTLDDVVLMKDIIIRSKNGIKIKFRPRV